MGERIAILTLQRLGDVLTAARVTDALSRRRSTASVEVVHFDATAQAAALLPGVTARHALPFAGLRRFARTHPIAALRSLAERVATIVGAGGFDTVVNLSSTRFACWLAPALLAEGGRVRGPWIDARGQYVADAPPLAYLNDWGVDPSLGVFAHQDLYAAAVPVRLAGFAGLRTPDARRTGPIVVQVHGSERAKDWRTHADWAAVVGQLQARFGRPCVLVGAPAEADALARIAAPAGARVATVPLVACADLLAEASGLVGVDTVSIHLAAAVGCPSVVLRQGPARGYAFVPGPRALLLDAEREHATVTDVVDACGAQFFSAMPSSATATALAGRVRVREAIVDEHGWLGLGAPSWCPADPIAAEDARCDERWRRLWRRAFTGAMPDGRELDELIAGSGRHEEARRAALFASSTLVGVRARSHVQPGRAA
ncbi:MAG TPA: glycosyltransferase family 9 protein [Nannocystaceae bacterium]|nr:glycosyltransferase family 9 protein [Nannocystaceae bacterium]